MFCQTGRIVDSFIPVNKSIGLGRGSPLVRFGAMEEVERAIANVNGRSWGGGRRKIQVNLSRHVSTKVNAPFSAAQTTKVMSAIIPERGPGMGASSSQGQRSFVEAVSSNLHEEAWPLKRVRMAPWALEEGKKKLHRGLVGFLRSSTEGLHAADNCWVECVGSCRYDLLCLTVRQSGCCSCPLMKWKRFFGAPQKIWTPPLFRRWRGGWRLWVVFIGLAGCK